jgi:hypothetical protein
MAVKGVFTITEFRHYVKATEKSLMDQQLPHLPQVVNCAW